MIKGQTPNSSGRVLVVDDHRTARQSMQDILTHVGHEVSAASSAREALSLLDQQSFDVILTDLRMPGMDGIQFICQLEKRACDSQIVMVTAHASVETAVSAMRHGAFDYIEKPFDMDQLESLVQRALRHGPIVGKRSMVPDETDSAIAMIGSSPVMQKLREQIERAAATDVTVLVCGESGTGKELVARLLHQQSDRRGGPLVSLNCPALSPQLMESELFGHERGAFTSADAPRVGRFELADEGSILLDEISEIDLPLQAKLLRVLQERSFERVGSSQTKSVDVRVIATTNRDLQAEVASGNFREDLFYRLAVVPIQVPPLRHRSEDVVELAEHFLVSAASRLDSQSVELGPDAKQLLLDYHWPGNVRELQNLMTRVTVLSQGETIGAGDLAPWLIEQPNMETSLCATSQPNVTQTSTQGPRIEAGVSLQEMERALIEATLEKYDGHREKTAKALGIGVRTLTTRLRSFGYAPREKSFVKRTNKRAA